MDVCVVLDVVEHDLVFENYGVALLTVFVAGLDLESDATGHRRICKLQLEASFVFFSALFGQLQELAADLVQQLHAETVVDVRAALVDEVILVVELLICLALLEDVQSFHVLVLQLLIVLEGRVDATKF